MNLKSLRRGSIVCLKSDLSHIEGILEGIATDAVYIDGILPTGEFHVIGIDNNHSDTVSDGRLMPFPIGWFISHVKWVSESSDRVFIQDSKINFDKVRGEWGIGYEPLPTPITSFHELQNLYLVMMGYDFDIKKENETFIKQSL